MFSADEIFVVWFLFVFMLFIAFCKGISFMSAATALFIFSWVIMNIVYFYFKRNKYKSRAMTEFMDLIADGIPAGLG